MAALFCEGVASAAPRQLYGREAFAGLQKTASFAILRRRYTGDGDAAERGGGSHGWPCARGSTERTGWNQKLRI